MSPHEITQDGITYVPCRVAGKRVGLSADYIARFCREGSVAATRFASAWYVNENSLQTYLAEQERQREAYRWRLSAEAREDAQRAKFSAAQMIAPYPPPRKRGRKTAEVLVATLTLFAVTASGVLAFQNIAPEKFASAVDRVGATSQLAAATSLPWLDELASNIHRTFCPYLTNCENEQSEFATSASQEKDQNQHTTKSAEVKSTLQGPTPKPAPIGATTTSVVVSSNVNSPPATIIQQPIVERIRETVRTVVEPGVNASYVDDRLSLLESSLLSKISGVSSNASNSITQVYTTVGQMGRIEHLDELDLTDPTISNATITGGSISSLSSPLAIGSGGTGTSSSPAYGQLLLGNSSGAYDFTATSSLGLPTFADVTSSVGSATFGKSWEIASGALSPTTTIGIVVSASSTFSGGITASNATATNATSTNFFATLSRFTTAIADALTATAANIASLTSTTLVATNATTTRVDALEYVAVGRTATTTLRGDGVASSLPYASTTMITATTASTTNLWISSLAAGSLLKTTTGGQVAVASAGTDYLTSVGFGNAWEMASGYLAPTTTVGVIVSASSTISSGTQAGGLTINGGATTSGNAFFDGNATVDGNFSVTGSGVIAHAFDVANYAMRSVGQLLWSAGNDAISGNADTGLARYTAGVLKFTNGSTGNGGLIAAASSTIGNGTQAGGLTISGGATTTGTHIFALGSASAPSITFYGDTDVGLFRTTSDSLGFVSNDALRYYSPGAANPVAALSYSVAPFSGGYLQFGAGGGTSIESLGVGRLASQTLGLVTNGTERVRIDSSGLVGIATTSPWRTLSVNGSSDLGTNALAGSFTATSSTASSFPYASTTALTVSGTAYFPGSGIWNSSGNVGIGTTNPGRSLTVNTGNGYGIRHTNGTVNLETYVDGTSGQLGTLGAHDLVLYANNGSGGSYIMLTSSGNLGIGQSSPTYKLDVSGLGHFTGLVDAASFTATSSSATSTFAGGLAVETSGLVYDYSSNRVGVGTAAPIALLSLVVPDTATAPSISMRASGNQDYGFDIDQEWLSTGRLDFNSVEGGVRTTRLSLLRSSGNLGIASSTPGAKLSVTNTGSNPSFVVEDSTSPDTTPFIIDASGNVGIGTASPTYPFDLARAESGGALIGRIYNTSESTTDNHAALYLSTAGANGGDSFVAYNGVGAYVWYTGVDNSDSDKFKIANGSAIGTGDLLTITTSGNVGIGTTTPAQKLHISSSGSTYMRFESSGTDWDVGAEDVATDRFAFYDGTDWRMVIQTNGNVGVATTSPWRTLSVTGTVGFDGLTGSTGAGSLCLDSNKQVVYNSASDNCLSSTRATKHDILDLNLDSLSLVDQLQPVSFVYNGSEQIRYGFIAEDTAAVDEHLATYDASGTVSGIDDRSILAIVISAIKDLYARLQDYFARTERLEDEVDALKTRVSELEVSPVTLRDAGTQAQ